MQNECEINESCHQIERLLYAFLYKDVEKDPLSVSCLLDPEAEDSS